MLSSRIVSLIENHSPQMAAGLVERVRHSSRTTSFLVVPESELLQDAMTLYRNLGDWLLNKTETEVEYRYTQLGIKRAEQGIILSDLVWAFVITKEDLWRFLQAHALVDQVVELHSELEFLQLVGQFFDRALYYASLGFQQAQHRARRAA